MEGKHYGSGIISMHDRFWCLLCLLVGMVGGKVTTGVRQEGHGNKQIFILGQGVPVTGILGWYDIVPTQHA